MLPPVSPVKSISLSPKDSKQSRIPSLSLSISILSFTPSLSKSLGHALTNSACFGIPGNKWVY